jgi:hypothetical protein
MDYEERIGESKTLDLFCPERAYGLQLTLKNQPPLNASIAERVHLTKVSKFSIKRHEIFVYKNAFAYKFTVALTGDKSKHYTINHGHKSFHVTLELFRHAKLMETKNNLLLAGDFLEKAMDLLGKTDPYSLIPLSPQCDFKSILSSRPLEFLEEDDPDSENKLIELKMPGDCIFYLS